MTTASLSDLRYLYYGGGSSAEYAYLQGAAAAGITAQSIIKLGYSGAGSPEGVVDAPIGSVYTDLGNGQHYQKSTASGNLNGWELFDAVGLVVAPPVDGKVATANTLAFGTGVVADAQDRFVVNGDGKINWGTGAAVPDTNLYRSAVGVLKTDNSFQSVLDQVARVGVATQVTSGSVGGNAGLLFGSASDVNLYRSAVDTLKTDDLFIPGAGIDLSTQNLVTDTVIGTKIGTGITQKLGFFNSTPIVQPINSVALDTLLVNLGLRATGGTANFTSGITGADRLAIGASQALVTGVTAALKQGSTSALRVAADADTTTPVGGIQFGLSADTNLYRSAASTLKTDSSILSAINITSQSGNAGQLKSGNVGPSSEAGILFGSSGDVNLYRSAADNLKTDDALLVNNAAGMAVGSGQALVSGVTAAFKQGSTASLKVAADADTTTAVGGILFGLSGDVNLYRSAGSVLSTGAFFTSDFEINARFSGASKTIIGAVGPGATSGIAFGSAGDTNLYRTAANKLATDDGLVLNNGALAGATNAAQSFYGGSGAPNNANGVNGDIYFRTDGGALTTIYQRRAGAWAGIV